MDSAQAVSALRMTVMNLKKSMVESLLAQPQMESQELVEAQPQTLKASMQG